MNSPERLLSFLQDAEQLARAHQDEARGVHTRRYLEAFPDTEFKKDDQGLLVDDYTERSHYFDVRSGHTHAVARFIYPDRPEGLLSLPTLKYFTVDPTLVTLVAGARRPSEIRPSSAVEVSGLATEALDEYDDSHRGLSAVNILYTSMLRASLDQGHALWTMNVDDNQRKHLALMLGEDNVVEIGEPKEYIGPATYPLALNPHEVTTAILKDDSALGRRKKAYLLEVLDGVSERYLSPELIALMHDHGVATSKESVLSKVGKHKLPLLYGAMLGYAGVRFMPLAAGWIDEFTGDPVAFAHIDLFTAGTQIWGMDQYLQGENRARRAMGAVAAGASLYAPYIYVWANGGIASPVVNGIAGTLAGAATYLEIKGSVRDAKLRAGMEGLIEQKKEVGETVVGHEPLTAL